MAESFFASLKTEVIDRQSWATRAQSRRATFDYIEVFFNRRRLHSSLSYLTPVGYETPSTTTRPLRRHNQAVRRTGSTPPSAHVDPLQTSEPCRWLSRTRKVAGRAAQPTG